VLPVGGRNDDQGRYRNERLTRRQGLLLPGQRGHRPKGSLLCYREGARTRVARSYDRKVVGNRVRFNQAQVSHLVTRWPCKRQAALPLAKRYRAPAAPLERKYP
jgi:hypothetical protein